MKIGIRLEPAQGSLGGAEFSVATLAHALAAEHDVRILHHRHEMTAATLGAFSSLDLSRIECVYVEQPPEDAWSCSATSNPLIRYRQARAWQAELSLGSDLFVNFTHGVPPFCHARAGILIVLFPLFRRLSMWPRLDVGATPQWKRTGRRLYYDWEWKRRIDSYDATLSISAFARDWTERWWGVRTAVVHPPVDTAVVAQPKGHLILSVGRFATAGLNKRHLDTVELFRRLRADLAGWKYVCTGSLGTSTPDREYFERVRTRADGECAVVANLERAELKRLLGTSRIFWHAAGLGDREESRPEMSEHFGMATVEAMAAGAVPVVANCGGQREIVTHGVDGFLCSSLVEFEQRTLELAHDGALFHRMSSQAALTAQRFSADVFLKRIAGVMGLVSPENGTPIRSLLRKVGITSSYLLTRSDAARP